jgi:hypothetical protein
VSINFDPAGVKGYYDLPDVVFPITATPKFATMGDFAPTANTVSFAPTFRPKP